MKFSIITITYNRAHLISETIQSVLHQTYQDFEHIIIDDGSTDNTEEVIKKFNDDRIKYFKYNKSGNLSKLRNYGLINSSGEIISILDSDDIWEKNKLESVKNVFINNINVKVILHNIQYFKGISIPNKNYYHYNEDFFKCIKEEVLLFAILPFPIIIFKKEILNNNIFLNDFYNEGLQDFLIRLSVDFKIYFISTSLTKIRIHDNNTHSTIRNIPYYTNYYFTITKLLFQKKINIILFSKGIYLNSKNLIIHFLK